MNKIFYLLILIISLTACKKEVIEPKLSRDIVGNWRSDSGWQLPIIDKIGDGTHARFIETINTEGRYLTLIMSDSTYHFEITSVKKDELDLYFIVNKEDIHFKRWHPPGEVIIPGK